MRIEKLEFRNLNSLVGHYCIDFTDPSLSAAGMFIICGPTGAGKSTILDAISYALYGATPRLKDISASRNEIMSKDANECKACVTFENGGMRYTVTTKQRRVKKRIENGKPFSAPERILAQVEADGSERILYQKKVTEKVVELTGLSFDNFKRCMMLAQGEFSKFLKADAKDRAAVLSTITGTEIYDMIGQRVHEKYSSIEQEINALNLCEVLSPEELESKQMMLRERQNEQESLRAEVEYCRKALEWLARVADYEKRCQSAAADASAAVKLYAEYKESVEVQQLAAARSAEKVRPLYDAREAALKSRNDTQAALEMAKAELAKLLPEKDRAHQELAKRQKDSDEMLPILDNQCREVMDDLLPLERALKVAQARAQDVMLTRMQREKECQESKVQAAHEEQTRGLCLAEQKQHLEHLQELMPDVELPEKIGLIESRLKDLKKVAPERGRLPQLLELSAAMESCAVEIEKVLHGRSRETMSEQLHILELLEKARAEHKAAAERYASAQKKYEDAERGVKNLPSVDEAESRCRQAESNVEKLRTLCDIRENLADLYERFRRGEFKTCPCCGSSTPGEHPAYVEGSMLQAAKDDLKNIKRECDEISKLHQDAQLALATSGAALESARQEFTRMESRLREFGAPSLPEVGDLAQIKADMARVDALMNKYEMLEKQKNVAERYDDWVQSVRGFSAELPVELPAIEALVTALRRRADEFSHISKLIEQDKEKVALQAERCTQRAEAARKAEKALELTMTDCERTEAELAALQKKRTEIWSLDESSDAALKRIEDTRKKLNQAHEIAQKAFDEVRARIDVVKSNEQVQRGSLESAQKTLAEAVSKLRAELAEQGFADEEVYMAAAVHIPQIHARETRLRELENAETKARANASTLENERLRCLKEAVTDAEEEELHTRCSTARDKLEACEAHLKTLHAELSVDARAREANREVQARQDELSDQLARWDMLKRVLCTEKSQEGFKRYAQRITFDFLINSANAQLARLNQRYVLRPSPVNDFGLYVIDRWSSRDVWRDSSNLSGGESFVVSLALALGLSCLSGSNTSIDTLFLDEGFGTLDADTLKYVLGSLEQLRTEGKLIGIISHVEELKERMPLRARLEICRESDKSPHSSIAPHPAVRIL